MDGGAKYKNLYKTRIFEKLILHLGNLHTRFKNRLACTHKRSKTYIHYSTVVFY